MGFFSRIKKKVVSGAKKVGRAIVKADKVIRGVQTAGSEAVFRGVKFATTRNPIPEGSTVLSTQLPGGGAAAPGVKKGIQTAKFLAGRAKVTGGKAADSLRRGASDALNLAKARSEPGAVFRNQAVKAEKAFQRGSDAAVALSRKLPLPNLTPTRGASLLKGFTGKGGGATPPPIGKPPSNINPTTTRNLIPNNTATRKTIGKGVNDWIKKNKPALLATAGGVWAVNKYIETIALGKFAGSSEASTAGSFRSWISMDHSDPQFTLDTIATARELHEDKGALEQFGEVMPTAVIQGSAVNTRENLLNLDVMEAVTLDKMEMQQNGTSSDEVWAARRLQKIDDQQQQEARLVETHNIKLQMSADAKDEERRLRLIAVGEEIDLRADADRDERNIDVAFRASQRKAKIRSEAKVAADALLIEIAYWDAQIEQKVEYEAEQRRLNTEYWDRYWRLSAESRALSSPSKLNFGLLG